MKRRTPDPVIRAARPADLEALTALYNHYVEHSPATFDIEPRSLDERREWMGHYASTGPHRLLVAELEGGSGDAGAGELIGYACSSTFRPKAAYARSVEMTVYLAESARGRGAGTLLYERLFAALRDEPVHRAYAGITMPNPASVALHRKFGFEPVGLYHEVGRKFDRYWDVQWFEKRLG